MEIGQIRILGDAGEYPDCPNHLASSEPRYHEEPYLLFMVGHNQISNSLPSTRVVFLQLGRRYHLQAMIRPTDLRT